MIALLALPDKKAVEKFCRDLTVTHQDMADFLLGARTGVFSPYLYAYHFDQLVPDHLLPTDEDNGALAGATVSGTSPQAQKFMRKVSQLFQDRRVFCAHLIYDPSKTYWHLFYFDQRDMSHHGNHWRNGAHTALSAAYVGHALHLLKGYLLEV